MAQTTAQKLTRILHDEGDSAPESTVGLHLCLDDSFVTLGQPPLQSFL